MPAKTPTRPRGRPKLPAAQARPHRVIYRLTPAEYAALLAYRDRLGVAGLSPADAARNATVKSLENQGFLGGK